MSDEYDWEEWDSSSLSFGHHMVAGCIAGVSEHIVFFPIDTLRVHVESFAFIVQTNLQATTTLGQKEIEQLKSYSQNQNGFFRRFLNLQAAETTSGTMKVFLQYFPLFIAIPTAI